MGPVLQIEQAAIFETLGLLVLFCALLLRADSARLRAWLRANWRFALTLVLAWVACLALALLVLDPAFIHSALYGNEMMVDYLRFPELVSERGHGQGSYVVLGMALKALGTRHLAALATINAIFAVSSVFLMGAVAYLWTGRKLAWLAVGLLGGTCAAVLRTGYSEDQHASAMFWAALALLALVYAMRNARPVAYLVSGSAAIMALMTRQTFFPWPFLLLFIGLFEPAGRRDLVKALRSRAAWFWFLLFAGLALPRIYRFLADGTSELAGYRYFLSRDWPMTRAILARSILWDGEAMAALVLPLAIFGMARERLRVLLPTALIMLPYLVISFVNWHATNFGDRLGMSLPLVALLMLFAGMGLVRLADRWPRAAIALVIATVAGNLHGLRAVASEKDIQSAEYRYLERVGRVFPRPAVILYYSEISTEIRHAFPRLLFQNADADGNGAGDVRFVDLTRTPSIPKGPNVYFYQGIYCFAYNCVDEFPGLEPFELSHLCAFVDSLDEDDEKRFWGLAPIRVGLDIPSTMRPECRRFQEISDSQHFIETVEASRHDAPQVLFSTFEVPIGFLHLKSRSTTTTSPARQPGVGVFKAGEP